MADGAASAAHRELVELLIRTCELAQKGRYESAVAKALEAVALARDTTPPQSLLRAFALVRHAEYTISHQLQLYLRSGTGVDDATLFASAILRSSRASLREALPILFARADANTLLPGRMLVEEEESGLRLLVLEHLLPQQNKANKTASAIAAQLAEARAARCGQCFGYRVFLQAAFAAFLTMYPMMSPLSDPFPLLRSDDADIARQNIGMLSNCVMQAVRWLGASADGAPADAANNGVQWHLARGLGGLLDGTKLCATISEFVRKVQMEPQSRIQPDGFCHALSELWHSPQLANRRQRWAESSSYFRQMAHGLIQRADADIARVGLATCANAGCGAVESCPRAFKQCSKCSTAKYCSRECQLAAWPSHKRECKRLVAQREAGGASAS